ncbi:MAG: sigma-70 family RNA polymerase sigma factor [Alphaproteobacteria bacterium]|nr:sigma-70 family RNA polymerase sigma factor [Alphaproteobacteria bacterium]MCB9698536.1 sigma-70 family RNA polymerase sigma factor [Alphaproteobacteria bacterium]
MNAPLPAAERSDDQLLRAWSDGEDRAFDELYRRWAGRVTAFCLRMLGRREEAEEICVDAFARVVEGRARPQGSFRSWVFTVAHRACIDRLRRRTRTARVLSLFGRTAATALDPEEGLLRGERERALARAVDALPVDHRAIVLLAVVQELPAREVGEILGLTDQQVRSQLSYARRLLRDLIPEEVR